MDSTLGKTKALLDELYLTPAKKKKKAVKTRARIDPEKRIKHLDHKVRLVKVSTEELTLLISLKPNPSERRISQRSQNPIRSRFALNMEKQADDS